MLIVLLCDSEFWVLMIGLYWVFGDMNWFNLDFFFLDYKKIVNTFGCFVLCLYVKVESKVEDVFQLD